MLEERAAGTCNSLHSKIAGVEAVIEFPNHEGSVIAV